MRNSEEKEHPERLESISKADEIQKEHNTKSTRRTLLWILGVACFIALPRIFGVGAEDAKVPPKSASVYSRFAVEEARMHELCEEKAVCERYPDVKQECATAGSVERCISIKMHNRDISMCNEEGQLDLAPKDVPSKTYCVTLKLAYFLYSPS